MAVNINQYKKIKRELDNKGISLVAVSKTKTAEEIQELYNLGQRDFGENYVQELLDKYEVLPKDIRWHFIGHLQTNKVKQIVPFVYLIHGVDSEKLLSEIDRQGKKINRIIACLLQVYISSDETKFGFDGQELNILITQIAKREKVYDQACIKGVMGMATFSKETNLIQKEFIALKNIYDNIKKQLSCMDHPVSVISMGMSADYVIAINAGTTMVRIGSLLFGERDQAEKAG